MQPYIITALFALISAATVHAYDETVHTRCFFEAYDFCKQDPSAVGHVPWQIVYFKCQKPFWSTLASDDKANDFPKLRPCLHPYRLQFCFFNSSAPFLSPSSVLIPASGAAATTVASRIEAARCATLAAGAPTGASSHWSRTSLAIPNDLASLMSYVPLRL
ncbi:hypothetical protein V8E36_006889 [Tilletia maclaganii]